MARGKYARKRLLKELRACPVRSTQLSAHTVKALENAGIATAADLMLIDETKIRAIHGIGPKAFAEISELRATKQFEISGRCQDQSGSDQQATPEEEDDNGNTNCVQTI